MGNEELLANQFGAEAFSGAASTLALIGQVAPVICALIVAGAGGSAMCADLGSRTIREEIAAIEALGINPLHRLVVPRVLAATLVSAMLFGLVAIVGVAGAYYVSVVLQDVTPGAYVQGFSALSQASDLLVGIVKALLFGLVAGIVAAFRGLAPSPGPKGVGDAVNQAVVITVVLLFAINAVITAVYLNLVPDNLVGFSRIGAVSKSDACRPFDAGADGFVLGEGVGAVILKRLDDARRDGDRVYAVIKGVGVNNDGSARVSFAAPISSVMAAQC